MTNTHKLSLLSILVLSILLIVSCGGKETPEPEVDRIKRLLNTGGAWTLQTATVDGVDKLSLYAGLSILFGEETFTTTNGGEQWPASGTWSFTDATAKVIERNDGLLITLTEVAEKRVVIAFTWSDTTFEEGRSQSLSGNHIFTLTR